MRIALRFQLAGLVVLLGCSKSSGDNCGPGTRDDHGTCVVDESSLADSGADGDQLDATADGYLAADGADGADGADDAFDEGSNGDASADANTLFDPTPCLAGGNLLVVDGDPTDPIQPGPLTIDSTAPDAGDAAVTSWIQHTVFAVDGFVGGTELDTGQGWRVTFNLNDMNRALGVGEYEDIVSVGGVGYGDHAGLDVSGNGVECHVVTGRFRVIDYAATTDQQFPSLTVRRLTATFEQHCNADPQALRGCVHFECLSGPCP
jgi:hypothetical protein